MLSLLVAGSIIVATMFGISYSLVSLDNFKDGSAGPGPTIVLKDGSYRRYVLMAGERGVLIYFPKDNRISFQKADEIRRIEWQR